MLGHRERNGGTIISSNYCLNQLSRPFAILPMLEPFHSLDRYTHTSLPLCELFPLLAVTTLFLFPCHPSSLGKLLVILQDLGGISLAENLSKHQPTSLLPISVNRNLFMLP